MVIARGGAGWLLCACWAAMHRGGCGRPACRYIRHTEPRPAPPPSPHPPTHLPAGPGKIFFGERQGSFLVFGLLLAAWRRAEQCQPQPTGLACAGPRCWPTAMGTEGRRVAPPPAARRHPGRPRALLRLLGCCWLCWRCCSWLARRPRRPLRPSAGASFARRWTRRRAHPRDTA